MSKYFTELYSSYYNKIDFDKKIETDYNIFSDKVISLDTSISSFIKSVEESSWNEKGKRELVSFYLPMIKNYSNALKNSTTSSLSQVISLVKKDLYNLLYELKIRDEEYCAIVEKYENDNLNSSDEAYTKAKISTMETILSNLVGRIENKIKEIRSYNYQEKILNSDSSYCKIDLQKTAEELLKLYNETHNKDDEDKSIIDKLKAQVEKNKLMKMFGLNNGSDNPTPATRSELDNGNCVDLSLLDADWKVVNTQLSVAEYATLAYNKGIRQNSNPERYSDLCLAFSYVHASNLYYGSTSDTAESAYNWNHAGEFYDYFNDNKQETIQTVYQQVSEGKPVIMQVNGNKSGTSRHFVTVVGLKNGVSIDNVQESDLLILDSWDGQLERMDTNTSRFMTTGAQCNKSYSGYYLRILK